MSNTPVRHGIGLLDALAGSRILQPLVGSQRLLGNWHRVSGPAAVIVAAPSARRANAPNSQRRVLCHSVTGCCLSVQTVGVKCLLGDVSGSSGRWVGRVRGLRGGSSRAGARAYLGPRPGVGSRVGHMMVDGVCPAGVRRCGRSFFVGRPHGWRQRSAGSWPLRICVSEGSTRVGTGKRLRWRRSLRLRGRAGRGSCA